MSNPLQPNPHAAALRAAEQNLLDGCILIVYDDEGQLAAAWQSPSGTRLSQRWQHVDAIWAAFGAQYPAQFRFPKKYQPDAPDRPATAPLSEPAARVVLLTERWYRLHGLPAVTGVPLAMWKTRRKRLVVRKHGNSRFAPVFVHVESIADVLEQLGTPYRVDIDGKDYDDLLSSTPVGVVPPPRSPRKKARQKSRNGARKPAAISAQRAPAGGDGLAAPGSVELAAPGRAASPLPVRSQEAVALIEEAERELRRAVRQQDASSVAAARQRYDSVLHDGCDVLRTLRSHYGDLKREIQRAERQRLDLDMNE